MNNSHTFLRHAVIPVVMLGALLFVSCSESGDSPTNPATANGDYFPFGREYRWTYTSNILAGEGTPVLDFEMKIDTAEQNDRWYWFMLGRPLNGAGEWGKILGVKDEGNIVYSLGDNPPEGKFPLFQHTYAQGEAVPETITVQGTAYDAMRVDHVFGEDSLKVSWWFAPDVGLIKEYSEQGISLFNDDYSGEPVVMNTELVKFEKVQ